MPLDVLNSALHFNCEILILFYCNLKIYYFTRNWNFFEHTCQIFYIIFYHGIFIIITISIIYRFTSTKKFPTYHKTYSTSHTRREIIFQYYAYQEKRKKWNITTLCKRNKKRIQGKFRQFLLDGSLTMDVFIAIFFFAIPLCRFCAKWQINLLLSVCLAKTQRLNCFQLGHVCTFTIEFKCLRMYFIPC